MRRAGQLREAVLEPENLRLAFWKASRGKRGSAAQRAYAGNLEEELEALREGLAEGTYPVGRYERFTIFEPKERLICAAAFRERVLHHALMNVCEPWFERWLAPNTYACRKGKGQTAAVAAAAGWARRREWFLKWDVRKYFESVPHEGVLEMLGRRFKDAWAAGWFARILGTWVAGKDGAGRKRGVPIGNLTSQHLANLYLDPLDRLVQMRHGGEGVGYARYMDDFVFWADDRKALRVVREEAREVLAGLGLAPKGEAEPRRTAWGMDFLGMRVHRDGTRLSRVARRRFAKRSRGVVLALERGELGEREAQERLTSLAAFTAGSRCLRWRRGVCNRLEESEMRRGFPDSTGAGTGTTTPTTASAATSTGTVPPRPTTTTGSGPSAAEHRFAAGTRPGEAVPAFFRIPARGRTQRGRRRAQVGAGAPNAPGGGDSAGGTPAPGQDKREE